MKQPKCPSYCVLHPHRGRVWAKRLGFAAVTVASAAILLAVALVAVEGSRNDRQEFIDRCKNQGGRIIDLGQNANLTCKIGRLQVEYGD